MSTSTDKLHSYLEQKVARALDFSDEHRPKHLPPHVRPSMSAKEIIDGHVWGTYGDPPGKECVDVLLVDCTTEHLQNILRTQKQITEITRLVILAILMERGEV